MNSVANELTNPLAVIDSLYAAPAAAAKTSGSTLPGEWGERAHFIRAFGLEDEENFAKIPCLNDVGNAESIAPFSLVRYRCMVQDVFEPEFYSAVVEEASADGSATPPCYITTKYRECPTAASGKVLKELGRDALSTRGAYYCVPLPGETTWARQLANAGGLTPRGSSRTSVNQQAGTSSASTSGGYGYGGSAASSAGKRTRSDEDVDMSSVPPPPVADSEAIASRPLRRRGNSGDKIDPTGADKEINSDEFGLNFPLPWEEKRGAGYSTACIVKLYDDQAEALKVCESVEILGVLCIDPELANLGKGAAGPFADARSPSTALVPRLHGLIVRRLPFYNPLLPFTPEWLSEARLASAFQRRLAAPGAVAAARGVAMSLLSRGLGGDTLAAEYVLMQLASRVFARHGDLGLGKWSMNIMRWPDGLQVPHLFEAVSELVPRAVHLPVTAESLSSGRWKPKKDFEANRLVSGRLQLASGTLLLLDESQMSVGQLNTDGVKAFQAMQSLVTDQQLPCDYCNYDVNVPVEVNCLLVSRGPSLVKGTDVVLPLRPDAAQSSASAAVAPSSLDAARFLLGILTRQTQPLRIPDEVARVFGEDFSRVRQELEVGQELGHVWMSLARAMCLTHGEEELTVDRWRSVFELEKQRLQRCKQEGALGSR
eukprot:TRINITY_DN108681_c0_g1_i1.p1 TRINITY_DN108681_c0_g1~~TRINITY_DN108681_c0_g1_i1.p1  ORF type:complete len:657 (+),score=140.75 TRINITY_DN108681_c0_g1_i1:68-2038(+)